MIKKFHYLHHHAPQLERWAAKCYPSCFTLERKHKSVKRYADQMANCGEDASVDWDRNLLREVTAEHLHSLDNDIGQFRTDAGLQKPKKVSKAMSAELVKMFGDGVSFQTAHVSRCNEWERISKGDVVIARVGEHSIAAEVVQHISASCSGCTSFLTLLHPLPFKSELNRMCSKHVRDTNGQWVYTSQIDCAAVWAPTGASSCRILRPVHVHPNWVP